MSFTNDLETRVLQWALTNGTPTRPTAWYLALFTAAPSDTGGGTEVSGTAYARQSFTMTVTGDTASNTANVEFPVAGASWGTVTHVAVFDAVSAGNMLAYATLTASKTIATGDVFRIPAGDLDIILN